MFALAEDTTMLQEYRHGGCAQPRNAWPVLLSGEDRNAQLPCSKPVSGVRGGKSGSCYRNSCSGNEALRRLLKQNEPS